MAQDGKEQPQRTKILLPSFRDVQAAQRSKPPPNLFHSRASTDAAYAAGSSAHPSDQAGPSSASASFTAQNGNRQCNSSTSAAQYTREQPSTNGVAAMPGIPYSSAAGPSSRRNIGPVSTSYPIAHTNRGCTVDYKAMNANPNAILVSKRQEGNPLLKHIRNVRWSYADIVPDYIMGAEICGLFLSMRFHLLKPEYIHHRIKELQRSFRLRVLICHVDVDDVVEPLQQITRAALLNDVTLICGWSPEECARYLETYKMYETKPADAILGRTDEDYLSRLNAAFTTVRGVNKTDVLTLGSTFGTAANAMQASKEELSACPGLGPTKVKRLYDAFHEPFRKTLQNTVPTVNQSSILHREDEDSEASGH